MARSLRYEAAEAVYHVMARGDGGKVEVNHKSAKQTGRRQMNTAEALEAEENNGTVLPDLRIAGMLRCRVRYFTDGAVIGSKAFVNAAFAATRERFTEKSQDGARRLRGNGKAMARGWPGCCGA